MYLHFVQICAKLAESFFLIPSCSWLLARFSLLFVWVVSSATDENKHLYFLGCLLKEAKVLLCCFYVHICVHPPLPKASEPVNEFQINLGESRYFKDSCTGGKDPDQKLKQNLAITHRGWQPPCSLPTPTYQPINLYVATPSHSAAITCLLYFSPAGKGYRGEAEEPG